MLSYVLLIVSVYAGCCSRGRSVVLQYCCVLQRNSKYVYKIIFPAWSLFVKECCVQVCVCRYKYCTCFRVFLFVALCGRSPCWCFWMCIWFCYMRVSVLLLCMHGVALVGVLFAYKTCALCSAKFQICVQCCILYFQFDLCLLKSVVYTCVSLHILFEGVCVGAPTALAWHRFRWIHWIRWESYPSKMTPLILSTGTVLQSPTLQNPRAHRSNLTHSKVGGVHAKQ